MIKISQWKISHKVRILTVSGLIMIFTFLFVTFQCQAGDTNTIREEEICPNEYYGDTYESEVMSEDDKDISFFSESEKYNSEDAAAKYLRESMVARTECVSFIISSENSNWREVQKAIFNKAVAVTSETSAEEGDYIKYQYGGYRVTVSYTQPDQDELFKYELAYYISYYTTIDEEQAVSNRIGQIFQLYQINEMDDYDKIETIYDYITNNVKYGINENGDKHQFTAYGALCEGKAVCQGYANLLLRMLREARIDSRIISGTLGGANHAWNICLIDGQYYYMDATQDASYYFIGWSRFLQGRQVWKDYIAGSEFEEPLFQEYYNIAEVNYVCPDQWQARNSKFYYYKAGRKLIGWQEIDGKSYYFSRGASTRGTMSVGFTKIEDKVYYFQSWGENKGALFYGWLKKDRLIYYLDEHGEMAEGWKNINGNMYYFAPKGGNMYMGFADIDDKSYYFSMADYRKGVALTGLTQIGEDYYYLTPAGYTGKQQIGSKTWWFEKGKLIRIDT